MRGIVLNLLIIGFLAVPSLAGELPARLTVGCSDHDRDLPADTYRWQPNPLLGVYPYATEPGHTWRSYELVLAGEFVSENGVRNFDLGPGSGAYLRWWGYRGHECYPMDTGWQLDPNEAVGYARMHAGGWCWLRPYPSRNTATHPWNLWVNEPPYYPFRIEIPVLRSEVRDRYGEVIGGYEYDSLVWWLIAPGDLDADGDVDLGDLATLLSNYGQRGEPSDGDLDRDGDVDAADLAAMLEEF